MFRLDLGRKLNSLNLTRKRWLVVHRGNSSLYESSERVFSLEPIVQFSHYASCAYLCFGLVRAHAETLRNLTT